MNIEQVSFYHGLEMDRWETVLCQCCRL